MTDSKLNHTTKLTFSTGVSRRSALRGLGGVTAGALLAAGPFMNRALAQDATPAVTDPLFTAWAAAWEGNTARVTEIYAADVVGDDFATGEHFEGTGDIVEHIEKLLGGIPDLKITLTSGFICGDRAALEYLVGGSSGGNPVRFRIAGLFDLADGKIVREAHYWNPSVQATEATPTS